MSLTLSNIQRRFKQMSELRRQKLTTKNADEYYETDVRDLLRINDALMKVCCQMNMKLNEALGQPVRPFKTYWDTFDNAIEKLLTRKFEHEVIKPND